MIRKRGKTYYVDQTNGNDANSGNAEHSAWKTVAKVNATAFKPGDRVLFLRGETWAEELQPTTPGHPIKGRIKFGAYGSGNRPIIDGSAVVHSLELTSVTGFLEFQSMAFAGSNGADKEACRTFTHDLLFVDCDVYGSDYLGVSGWSADGDIIYKQLYFNCIFRDNTTSGFYVGSDDLTKGPHDCIIDSCEADDNGTTQDSDHGIYVCGGVTIRNCECHHNKTSGIKFNCNGDQSDIFISRAYNNYCHDNERFGFYLGLYKGQIYNNLSVNNGALGLYIDPDALYAQVIHNTFVNDGTEAVNWQTGATNTQVTFKDNLLVMDLAVVPSGNLPMNMSSSASVAANNIIDYNTYYMDGNVNAVIIGSRTFAIWKGLTGTPDVHGQVLAALPGFVTRYTDLHPAASGNLDGVGVALAGHTADKDEKAWGTPPAVGCYEAV